MLKNMNPEIFSDSSKYVYTMKTKHKKVPQFKKNKKTDVNKDEVDR